MTSTMNSPVIADQAYSAAADQMNRGLFDFVASTVSSFIPPIPFLGRDVSGGQPGYPDADRAANAQRSLLDAAGVALPALVEAFPKIVDAWQKDSRSPAPPPNQQELTRGWTDALTKLAPHVINGTASVLSSWVGSRDIRKGDLDAQSRFMAEYTRAVLPSVMAEVPRVLDDLAPGSRAVGEERNERFLPALLALAPAVVDIGAKIGKSLGL